MNEHLSSPEHARERTEFLAETTEAAQLIGMSREAIELLTAVMGRIYDMGCEFNAETANAAATIGPVGEAQDQLDRLMIAFIFHDAEPLREEYRRAVREEEIKHERSN